MQSGMFAGRPEIWAGLECTVNRIGDLYHDQISRTGHDRRPDDLDRLAALGLRTLRYPILWERHERVLGGEVDWSETDSRMARMLQLGLRPIAGLVHHGSGPPGTSLVDPGFAAGLERFAGRVAERYPWIGSFTPINEPLTTARFSGLYGLWYPHGRDPRTFAQALLGECRATVLAMRAIRRHVPQARLIQTDDLGQTYSAHNLNYQADFENERRWLSWDLLFGRVDRRHPLADYLLGAGIREAELFWFLDNRCPPM